MTSVDRSAELHLDQVTEIMLVGIDAPGELTRDLHGTDVVVTSLPLAAACRPGHVDVDRARLVVVPSWLRAMAWRRAGHAVTTDLDDQPVAAIRSSAARKRLAGRVALLAELDQPSMYELHNVAGSWPSSQVHQAYRTLVSEDISGASRWWVHKVVHLLRHKTDLPLARSLSAQALQWSLPSHVRIALQACARHAELLAGAVVDDWQAIARDTMKAADKLLEDRPNEAGDVALIALELLFDYEHHVDVIATPLIDDTAAFVAPVHNSRLLQLVTDAEYRPPAPPTASAPAAMEGERATEANDTGSNGGIQRKSRVVVLRDRYANFADDIVTMLRNDPHVDLRVVHYHEVAARTNSRSLALLGTQLRNRLAPDGSLTGTDEYPHPDDLEWLAWADTVFVDWAATAAHWAAMWVPDNTRLVVRLHSLEALGHQVHQINWHRVDDLVFVGSHIRDLTHRSVAGLPGSTRTHVMANTVRTDRFTTDKTPQAEYSLGMVGWAQRVKDPVWTLHLLAGLRRHDSRWRLALFGHDFSSGVNLSNRRYRHLFDATVDRLGLHDAVIRHGFRTDLDIAMRDVGWIVSSSRRESFAVGLIEGAASGAIPVVRHWTMFHGDAGPHDLFPSEWIVDDVDQAVQRVLATCHPRIRPVVAERTRDQVLRRYPFPQILDAYRDLLVGPPT